MVRGHRWLLSAALFVSWSVSSLYGQSALARERGRVAAIERSMSGLTDTPAARHQLTLVRSKRFELWIKPAARVIGVRKGWFSRQGFFLDRRGHLSSKDRGRLESLLERNAPQLSANDVQRSVQSEVQRYEAHDRALRKQDGTIEGLLRDADKLDGRGDRVLWRQGRASLVYRPSRDVLVGKEGFFGGSGFFLKRTAKGLEVRPEYLDGLREFLNRHR